MNTTVQSYMQRPLRYETIDGSGELGWGLMGLGFALSSYLGNLEPRPPVWLTVIVWVVFSAAAFAPLLVPKIIKRLFTWRRTGYVAYRRDTKAFWIALIVTVVLAGGVAVGLARYLVSHLRPSGSGSEVGNNAHPIALLAAYGVMNALLYLMLNAGGIGNHRWKWFLLVPMILGPLAITSLIPGGFFELSRPVMFCNGLLWVASGGATLCSYLRQNQASVPGTA